MTSNKSELFHGDCLDVMKDIPDTSVDMVLCDPPYGTTACKWDSAIDFEPMWDALERVVKPNAAICLFGGPPFGAALIMSNPKAYRHEWIWQKSRPGNFVVAKHQPLREHEAISVFGFDRVNYYPIKEKRKGSGAVRIMGNYKESKGSNTRGTKHSVCMTQGQELRYPGTIQPFNNIEAGPRHHPTQKPVALLEYLIKTYSKEGETVLDFTMGSGSTGVACKNTGRKFIGIEKNEDYFKIAKSRIAADQMDQRGEYK